MNRERPAFVIVHPDDTPAASLSATLWAADALELPASEPADGIA